MFKQFYFQVILLVFWFSAVNSSCSTGWTSYKDEKCFLAFPTTLRTQADAAAYCTSLSTSSTLLSIKTKAEQDFLIEFIFGDSGILDSVYLGAKRSLENKFYWTEDNSLVKYNNWADDRPSNDRDHDCVWMSSNLTLLKAGTEAVEHGLWSDASCLFSRPIVCQDYPSLNPKELARILYDLNRRVEDLEANAVPVGFVYVQLGNQSKPEDIWPGLGWDDKTEDYAGLFFRAEGKNSEEFGQVQNENSPVLKRIEYQLREQNDPTESIDLTIGKFSELLISGKFSLSQPPDAFEYHRYLVNYTDNAKPEVRPVNTAVNIWVRTK